MKGALIRGDVTKMKIWKNILDSFDPQLKVPTVVIEYEYSIQKFSTKTAELKEKIWDPVFILFLMIKDLVAKNVHSSRLRIL